MRLAITGANSSVGVALLRHVHAQGDVEVHAGVRSETARASLPDGPRLTSALVDYDEASTLDALLTGADVAIHLAGILIETAATRYETANVGSVRAVVEACRRVGVPRVVLVSAVGADPDSSNAYFRSKGEAEGVVTGSGLAGAVLRTPMLLGPDSAGGRSLVAAASRPAVRLLGGGRHVLRPLDLDDLSAAIVACARRTDAAVVTFDLVGPEPRTHRELVADLATLRGREVRVGTLPVGLAKLLATVRGWLRPGGMTPVVIDVITHDESVDENADTALGLTLTPLRTTLEKLLPREDASA